MLVSLIKDITKLKDPIKAKHDARFFKTKKGEYGEGDYFFGLNVPQQRILAKKYSNLTLQEIKKLLQNPIHEYRQIALYILASQFKKGSADLKKKIYELYLKHTRYINNWDLVDLSAYHIVGQYLLDKPKNVLEKLARSKNLWERRISIITTYAFIKQGDYTPTLKLARILLKDKHDLIHKAVGWMLREIGKKNQVVEEEFLLIHSKQMPRTMLRYAIEKFSQAKRKFYMQK